MARHRDENWNLPDKATWESAKMAVLMDIRDELKSINAKLGCYRIQRMFSTIERIDKRLSKKMPLRGNK